MVHIFVFVDFHFGSESSMIATDQSKIEGDPYEVESPEDEAHRIIGTKALGVDMSGSESTLASEQQLLAGRPSNS